MDAFMDFEESREVAHNQGGRESVVPQIPGPCRNIIPNLGCADAYANSNIRHDTPVTSKFFCFGQEPRGPRDAEAVNIGAHQDRQWMYGKNEAYIGSIQLWVGRHSRKGWGSRASGRQETVA